MSHPFVKIILNLLNFYGIKNLIFLFNVIINKRAGRNNPFKCIMNHELKIVSKFLILLKSAPFLIIFILFPVKSIIVEGMPCNFPLFK